MSDDDFPELAGLGLELRAAGADDGDLIRRIVAMATHWRDEVVPAHLPSNVDKYHQGWRGPDDVGVFAFRGIEFAGGAFLRRFGPADGAYGYIADEYLELTIGVEAGFRKQGIARLCLITLQARAIERGVAGISLSVEPDNFARHLYFAAGFELIEDRGHDLLMLWRSPVTRAGTPPAV